jgi:CRP-like cAMP-binding protein
MLIFVVMFDNLQRFLNTYSPVSSEDFETLMSVCEVKEYPRKAQLTKTGEVEQYLYFVTKGLIRMYFRQGRHDTILYIVKEDELICSGASFFSQTPSRYIVEAIEPVTVLALSRTKLDELLDSGNHWQKFARLMTAHFLVFQEYRLLDNIRYTARERFKIFMQQNPELLLRTPQKYLASYLNIKPETFSRMKHLLVDKNKLKKSIEHPV